MSAFSEKSIIITVNLSTPKTHLNDRRLPDKAGKRIDNSTTIDIYSIKGTLSCTLFTIYKEKNK